MQIEDDLVLKPREPHLEDIIIKITHVRRENGQDLVSCQSSSPPNEMSKLGFCCWYVESNRRTVVQKHKRLEPSLGLRLRLRLCLYAWD
jgi:hypothetical protein